jgi:nucleotide-binding universal stress UspA family protein
MGETNRPLVVGVDGSDASLTALEWAAAEAARHGWPLRLVHAYLARVPELAYVGRAATATGDEQAEQIFAAAREHLARTAYGAVRVSEVSREGHPRRVLLRAAAQARALMVGRAGTGRLSDLFLGSTSLACAMHAKGTPVVVVPADWNVARSVRRQHRRVVVVGVDGSRRCRGAVDYAFATASRWEGRLVAVMASADPDRAGRVLGETLADWTATYPAVPVTKVVKSAHPAVAVLNSSHQADLVVVGGRGHGEVTGMLLGSVARAVLYLVDRPTAVVHQLR